MEQMKTKVLLVDDDALLRHSLQFRLEQDGYAVQTTATAEEGLAAARRVPPDLILLDIGLPDQLGLDVARILQKEQGAPIIFLTARRAETDIVVGLELGADDYITKPFGMMELLARMRVTLRRGRRSTTLAHNQILAVGPVVLDERAHQVTVRNARVDLPLKEFELLRVLMTNAGSVLTTDYLLNAVWGQEFVGAQHVLYVHMGWLRERIETDPRNPRYIVTIRGVGYKFVAGEIET
jgi:DNA-binding response OmpR family regulator